MLYSGLFDIWRFYLTKLENKFHKYVEVSKVFLPLIWVLRENCHCCWTGTWYQCICEGRGAKRFLFWSCIRFFLLYQNSLILNLHLTDYSLGGSQFWAPLLKGKKRKPKSPLIRELLFWIFSNPRSDFTSSSLFYSFSWPGAPTYLEFTKIL